MQDTDFSSDIKEALNVLKNGGIILYPTDTVWGIGCDARNSQAVKKIYDLKKREDSKSMIVLVNNIPALERIVDDVPDAAYEILDNSVSPITLILDEAHNVAPEIIADDGSLGIRVTNEKFSNELCKRLGAPLVSTSANLSGHPSPASFSEISDEIKKGVDYIVNYRRNDSSKASPSSIIKIHKNGVFKIIR